jgi:hypothetical protein
MQEKLQDITETVNRMSITRSKFFFNIYGKKENLRHRPINQINGKRPGPSKNINFIGRQHKFHKKVSDMLLSLRLIDHWWVNPIDKIGEISEVAHEESNEASLPSQKLEDVDGLQELNEVE